MTAKSEKKQGILLKTARYLYINRFANEVVQAEKDSTSQEKKPVARKILARKKR